jgi:hypothetical membrane protein
MKIDFKNKLGLRCLLPAAVIMLFLVMFILPFFSFPGYSILKNTTSHLGAQGAPHAWIMNMVFIFLGGAVVLEAWLGLRGYRFHQVILIIFGLGLIGVGLFRHAPLVEGVPVNLLADTMHSIFASTVGFSFILFAVSAAFIETTPNRRRVALLTAAMATFLSALMFTAADYAGLWQRLMFILSFGWLLSLTREPGLPPH